MVQLHLIEPTGGELLPLIVGHLRAAVKYEAQAAICKARGLELAASEFMQAAGEQYSEADDLEMLLTFEALGRVHA
jgi:hypothetical protein